MQDVERTARLYINAVQKRMLRDVRQIKRSRFAAMAIGWWKSACSHACTHSLARFMTIIHRRRPAVPERANVPAAVFWLKNRRPESWRDSQEMSIGTPIKIELAPEEKEV